MSLFLLCVLGVSWGLSFAIIKAITSYEESDLISVTIVTLIASTLLAIAYGNSIRPKQFMNRKVVFFCFICGLTSFLVPLLIEMYILQYIDVMVTSVVISSAPIFSLLFFCVGRRSRLRLKNVVAVATGFLGCFLAVSAQGEVAFGKQNFALVSLLLLIPALYGYYHYFVEVFWPDNLDAQELAVGELLVCSIACVVLLASSSQDVRILHWNPEYFFLCTLLGVTVAIEAVLYFKIQKMRGAVFCSFADYIATVVGVLSGYYIFNESTGYLIYPACALVLLAVWLNNYIKPETNITN